MDSAVDERSIPHQHRFDRYIELGFTEPQAELLASARTVQLAKDTKGVIRKWTPYVYHGDVADALAKGCSHELAVEIFS